MPLFLTTADFGDERRERFRAAAAELGADHRILALGATDEGRLAAEVLEDIEIAFYIGDFAAGGTLARRFFGAALRAPNLRWMHLPNAGVDDPIFHRMLASGTRLTTSSGASAAPVAQSAIAGLMALARRIPDWRDAQLERRWAPRNLGDPPADLRGQRVVVVGQGPIGQEIARLAHAIGMDVVGLRRAVPGPDERPPWRVESVDGLAAELRDADWVILACPLTPQTHHLIDAERLAAMKPTARLVNIARGDVVDEAALVDALREGRMAGAYLDVFSTEPLPEDSPLWTMPGVLVSPHDAAGSHGNADRQAEIFFANYDRYVRGKPLLNEVAAPTAPDRE